MLNGVVCIAASVLPLAGAIDQGSYEWTPPKEALGDARKCKLPLWLKGKAEGWASGAERGGAGQGGGRLGEGKFSQQCRSAQQ